MYFLLLRHLVRFCCLPASNESSRVESSQKVLQSRITIECLVYVENIKTLFIEINKRALQCIVRII